MTVREKAWRTGRKFLTSPAFKRHTLGRQRRVFFRTELACQLANSCMNTLLPIPSGKFLDHSLWWNRPTERHAIPRLWHRFLTHGRLARKRTAMSLESLVSMLMTGWSMLFCGTNHKHARFLKDGHTQNSLKENGRPGILYKSLIISSSSSLHFSLSMGAGNIISNS